MKGGFYLSFELERLAQKLGNAEMHGFEMERIANSFGENSSGFELERITNGVLDGSGSSEENIE